MSWPEYYGIRMEFLEIEMNKEEQLAFFANQGQEMSDIETALEKFNIVLEEAYAVRYYGPYFYYADNISITNVL